MGGGIQPSGSSAVSLLAIIPGLLLVVSVAVAIGMVSGSVLSLLLLLPLLLPLLFCLCTPSLTLIVGEQRTTPTVADEDCTSRRVVRRTTDDDTILSMMLQYNTDLQVS